MEAGIKLDALIAKHVMGLDVIIAKPSGGVICSGVWNRITPCDDGSLMCEHPTYDGYMHVGFGSNRYSADIKAAWEVVEKMDLFIAYSLQKFGGKYVVLDEDRIIVAGSDTAPHAICLAALKAKGVEIED